MREIVLGSEQQFGKLPAEVEIEHHPYFLVKDGVQYRLLSRICPHAGYQVEVEDGELFCPLHGWTFDIQSGKCLNVPVKELAVQAVEVRDGVLVALVG